MTRVLAKVADDPRVMEYTGEEYTDEYTQATGEEEVAARAATVVSRLGSDRGLRAEASAART